MASDLAAMINGCSDIITELHKVQHSPKLVALQEILEECGIGSEASSSDGTLSVGQHRVLIFAQHKVIAYGILQLSSSIQYCPRSNHVNSCRLYWTLLKKTCFKPT